MENCIFCQIVKGKIPCYKVYEDKNFLAFLDIMPYTKGHTLVIPKKHYRWVWDLPSERNLSPNVGEYFTVCQKLARKMQKVFSKELVATLTLGEAVPHAHIHLLPNAEPSKIAPLARGKLKETDAKRLVKLLKDGPLPAQVGV
jgi:histidine triad (HIT) family protein